MLARSAGLELGDTGGVACDSALRASADGVWAAGDVCEYDSVVHGRRLRVEHWEVARSQGAHVAAGIMGEAGVYAEIPYFWSDIADWCTLESVGPPARWDREVVRGSLDDGAFTIFYVDGDRLAGALTVGRSEDLDDARGLLADPGAGLAAL
jgi:3-phenylpropionate/trans-cinnamate dioxygenase ferredoxin reductase subunit